jgi:hypothetical protein
MFIIYVKIHEHCIPLCENYQGKLQFEALPQRHIRREEDFTKRMPLIPHHRRTPDLKDSQWG